MHIQSKVNKDNCCGCTACSSICPKNAIIMQNDSEGFKYPKVDEDICISCGLCEKVCPVYKPELSPHNKVKASYAMKHKNKDILSKSTSGGMFTALSDYVLSKGGAVYGAAFDDLMVVRHIRATNANDRDRMRGSKYVQSDIDGIFSLVKSDLKNDKLVLFSGTPCQVEGLRKYLNGKTENLILMDFICHGVPSPRILAEHFKLLEDINHSRLISYQFRPKRWTWHAHKEISTYENGKEYHSCFFSEIWCQVYYMKLATRPSCHNCKFSNLNRPGDITVGDCRGIDKIAPDFGSDEGVSLVLINTDKGKFFFNEIIDNINILKVNIEDIIQPPMISPSSPNPRREHFWNSYYKDGYKKTILNHWGKLYPLKYYIKKVIKKIR